MLFKKGVLPVSKDLVAEGYQSALEEHRKKIKDKTEEIRKCINDKLAKSNEIENIELHDQNGNTNKDL
jgi:hypothetical protein